MTASQLRVPARFGLLLAAALAVAAPAAAQEVRGRVVTDLDGAPLVGAYVVLVDGTGEVVARTLSTPGGSFALEAPAAGDFTVRAEHIGYQRVEAPVTAGAAGAAVVELRAPVRAIELEGLVAEVDRECRVDANVALRLAELWEEVSKAFQVTAFVEEQGTFLLETDRWRRVLEPRRLRVQEEERHPRVGFHRGSPFVSLPAERLAEEGYIHGDRVEGHRYYGPDARVLMSRSFQDTHCFGFTDDPPDDGEPGWVGIRIRPRDRSTYDIEGTLWIDEDTYEPKRLDYRYDRLPYPLETRVPGGRVEFIRIPSGPWIVHRWRIRTPVTGLRRVEIGTTSRLDYVLQAVMEDGGEVLRVQPAGERRRIALGALGRVEGTVRLTTGAPVEGARVTLEGTAFRVRTDEEGRFTLTGVPEGRYAVAWTSPALDSLDLPGDSREIDVARGEVTSVDAVLAPAGVLIAEFCGDPLLEDGTGVVRGRVEAADAGGVPDGTTVELRWEVVERLGSMGGTGRPARPTGTGVAEASSGVLVQDRTFAALIPVEPSGAWMVCGVPHQEELVLRAVHDVDGRTRAGQEERLTLAEGEIRAVTLRLPPG